jgi:hypothetical protein
MKPQRCCGNGDETAASGIVLWPVRTIEEAIRASGTGCLRWENTTHQHLEALYDCSSLPATSDLRVSLTY